MGKIKNLFIEMRNLGDDFVYLLAEFFRRERYKVEERNDGREEMLESNFIVGSRSNEKIVVDIKLYRSERMPPALLRNAFVQLNALASQADATRAILVVTQPLSGAYDALPELGSNELWDLTKLIDKLEPYPDLSVALAELTQALRIGAEKMPDEPAAIATVAETGVTLPELGSGGRIAKDLEELPAGSMNQAANKFENLCEKALRLLYGDDFLGWKRQSDIEEGFQRLDLIARLVPTRSRFWKTLSVDFRTRYVIFEFKNYSGKINQDQIFSTEKYLFTTALRSVALIIARNGASDSANRAIRGALREQGKLILCISMDELCVLLRGYDNGDDPTNLLVNKLDDLLMSVAR